MEPRWDGQLNPADVQRLSTRGGARRWTNLITSTVIMVIMIIITITIITILTTTTKLYPADASSRFIPNNKNLTQIRTHIDLKKRNKQSHEHINPIRTGGREGEANY